MTYLVAFVLSFVVAAVLTPILRAIAPLIGGIDKVKSSRKVHKAPIPRIGGVAIVAGFYAPLIGLFVWENSISNLFLRNGWLVAGLFAGGLTIAGLGFIDDLYGIRARMKLAIQLGVALVLWGMAPGEHGNFQIHVLAGIPLGPFALPVTVLWIVGIINAINLIDGLDGLAGGVAAIAVGLNFAIAFGRPDVLMCLFMAALGGAVVGFLLYNFNPATIFMGDTGSMFLGFVLAATSVVSSQKSTATVSMLVPIIGLGLPIADTLLAMVRRSLRGRPIFSADREHIHHKLLDLGLTHRQAVLALYGVCLTLASLAFALTYAGIGFRVVILTGLAIAIVVTLNRLGYFSLDKETGQKNADARARNQSLRGVVREIGQQLKTSDDIEMVWNTVKHLAPAFKAREMRMSILVREEAGEQVRSLHSWRDPEQPDLGPSDPCVVTLPLDRRPALGAQSAATVGELQVTWTDGRRHVDRDDEIALEMVKDHIETALDRLMATPGKGLGQHTAEEAPQATVVEFRRRRDG